MLVIFIPLFFFMLPLLLASGRPRQKVARV